VNFFCAANGGRHVSGCILPHKKTSAVPVIDGVPPYLPVDTSKMMGQMRNTYTRLARSSLGLIFSLAVGPAHADDATEIRLPLGTVQMTQTFANNDLLLTTETETLSFESSYFPEVEALSGNSFLIFLASGEHECAGYYRWATLDDAGLRASPPFGSCSDRGEVLRTAKGLMLVMPGPKASAAVSYFLNKDGTVTENSDGLESDGIVDPF
jgi:hypothetical protein